MTSEQEQAIALLEAMPPDVRRQALRVLERLSERDPSTGPFGWQIGLHYVEHSLGRAQCFLDVDLEIVNLVTDSDGEERSSGAGPQPGLGPKAPGAGRISATATVLSKRSRLAVVSAEARDAQDQLVGVALGTFAIIDASAPGQSES